MSTREIIYAAAGASGPATYIEDVFSTWLYTGTSATQTITNNIDLSGKGGIVWTKSRSNTSNQYLVYSDGSTLYGLYPNLTNAQGAAAPPSGHVFNNNGFTIDGSSGLFNFSGYTYASWTFRKQAKFFDVVTYTGNGVDGRTISHSLGSVPGMIIVKRTNTTGNWEVFHRAIQSTPADSANYALRLNLTNAAAISLIWGSGTPPTSTQFTVSNGASVNASGGTYVAYLFAHNAGGFGTSGSDNVISCGSYTDGASTVNLGYEPQYILVKNISTVSNWLVIDNMRGFAVTDEQFLIPNSSSAELTMSTGAGQLIYPTATGFTQTGAIWGGTMVYMAIRRGPMKTPTSGTSIYTGITRTGTGANATISSVGYASDAIFSKSRTGLYDWGVWDRLRGITEDLFFNKTDAGTTDFSGLTGLDSNVGYSVGTDGGYGTINASGQSYINYALRRAPGFFDVVCYTGTGSNTTQTHNLGVAPELIITKSRSTNGYSWGVYAAPIGATRRLILDGANAQFTDSTYWNNTAPTSSVFTVGTNNQTNASGTTYVAYLFATVAGVSKVGSYTGTGSTQTINAGLPTGARFVLIKRTDSTGSWWVWDTARGMVAGTDPRLALNSTNAETNANWVYTTTNGFQIVTTDATVNANGGSYIYLAIA